MKARAWSFVVGSAVCVGTLALACSANGGRDAGRVGGGGASTTTGGTQPNLTSIFPNGGTTDIIGIGADGGGGELAGCNDLSVMTKKVTPTVLLLVDNSSSMFEPRAELWDPLYNALMKPTDGIVAALQNDVRFGFTSYRGSAMDNDPACPNLFEVDYKLGNFDPINAMYKAKGDEYTEGSKWETPTGAALKKVATKLAAFTADPPGPKYIVLVTDGNPNTCAVRDPQCGSDESIKAVQDAQKMGIGTFAVGIGDIVGANTGCDDTWGRCGINHLQDLANAGQGLPVQAPPADLVKYGCNPGGTLAATYAGAAEMPGTAKYFTAANAAELEIALRGLLNSVVSCTYDMNATVVGNPALGTVQVNGESITYNDPNGWRLEPNKVQITLQGTACDKFKSQPGSKLLVSFPCKVAVPK